MLKEVQKLVDFIVQDGNITCKPKTGHFDAPTILKLQKLQNYKVNTIHLLKTSHQPVETVIAVDIETTALKPRQGEIKLISMFGAEVALVDEMAEEAVSILADSSLKKVFHNAGFDVTWLRAKGYEVNNFAETKYK